MTQTGTVVPGPAVGEVWAYRARSIDDVVPVRVLREGAKKPRRLLVRFEEPDHDGWEDWVPPARLKVRWSEVDAFRTEEARWKAVDALSPYQETAEVRAAEHALRLLVDEEIADFGYKAAHLEVHEPQALAAIADIDVALLSSDPVGFKVDPDGPLIVPWPVALGVVKRALALNADLVLAEVAQEEATARYEAIHGHHFSTSGRNARAMFLSPEQCVEFDRRPDGAPKRRLLREWAGDASDRWDELLELRKEIRRVGEVAEQAIEALRRHGHERDADRLSTELGTTVEMLRRGE